MLPPTTARSSSRATSGASTERETCQPAGRLVLPGIDTIDVTAASTDVFTLNHSEYAENNALLSDIGKLIESGLRPPDVRFDKLKPVTSSKGSYWRYAVP